jgi:type II secretory pathway pseudopilin PulG
MKRSKSSGFTLVEVTIILLILVILGAILLPTILRFIDLARLARVKEDVGALAAVTALFLYDNCISWFFVDGDWNCYSDINRIDMLIGDGDIPPTIFANGSYDDFWSKPFGRDQFVDRIENHLALGDPFYPIDNSPSTSPYPLNLTQNPWGCGFRGAYLATPINPDPWGNRYMINVAWLGPRGTSRVFGTTSQAEFNNYDVFVLSAGPDEIVSTEFQVGTPPIPIGVLAGGDDVIALIGGSGI